MIARGRGRRRSAQVSCWKMSVDQIWSAVYRQKATKTSGKSSQWDIRENIDLKQHLTKSFWYKKDNLGGYVLDFSIIIVPGAYSDPDKNRLHPSRVDVITIGAQKMIGRQPREKCYVIASALWPLKVMLDSIEITVRLCFSFFIAIIWTMCVNQYLQNSFLLSTDQLSGCQRIMEGRNILARLGHRQGVVFYRDWSKFFENEPDK